MSIGNLATKFVVSLFLLAAISAFAAEPKSAAPQKIEAGRFVALQPPAAGEKTYANFLWVVDTATGYVSAYRIANVKNEKGEHETWITERLFNEVEYYQLRSNQNK